MSINLLGNTGTVFLLPSSVSTRAGATNVWAGTLKLSGLSQPAGTGTISVFNGGTVEFNGNVPHASIVLLNDGSKLRGTGFMASSVNAAGSVTVATSAAVTFETLNASDEYRLGSVMAGGSAGSTITVNGPGRMNFGAANTYRGDWIVNGILNCANAGALGNVANTATINSGGVLAASAVTIPNQITLNNGSALGVRVQCQSDLQRPCRRRQRSDRDDEALRLRKSDWAGANDHHQWAADGRQHDDDQFDVAGPARIQCEQSDLGAGLEQHGQSVFGHV